MWSADTSTSDRKDCEMKPYYQDASCTIYHGDCREVLPTIPKVDLVLTDPPYGIGAYSSGKMGGGVLAKQSSYDPTTWDSKPIDWQLLESGLLRGKYACCWGGNYYPVAPSSAWLVWDKVNGANNFADCELAWTNYGIAVRMKKHQWHGMLRKGKEARHHPTQKPLELMEWCISLCPDDAQTILDPFMGSGTTLRAAKDLQRTAIGIEREERYCEIAAKRLEQEVLPLGM